MTLDEFVNHNHIVAVAGQRILELTKQFETLKGTFDRALKTIAGLRDDLDTRDSALEGVVQAWVAAEDDADDLKDQLESRDATIAGKDSEIAIGLLRARTAETNLAASRRSVTLLIGDLNNARKQRNELKDSLEASEAYVESRVKANPIKVTHVHEVVFRPIQWATICTSRDAQILDLQHDLAYSYEARDNVMREFVGYKKRFALKAWGPTAEQRTTATECAIERNQRKLRLRAYADTLTKAVGNMMLGHYDSARASVQVTRDSLGREWRNA